MNGICIRLNGMIKIILLCLISTALSSAPSLDFESSNGDFKAHLGGRLQLDAAKYFDDGPVSLGSGVEVRRRSPPGKTLYWWLLSARLAI